MRLAPPAGVAGKKTPKYSVFGDSVNTASRMATTLTHSGIQLSKSTVDRVCSAFHLVPPACAFAAKRISSVAFDLSR